MDHYKLICVHYKHLNLQLCYTAPLYKMTCMVTWPNENSIRLGKWGMRRGTCTDLFITRFLPGKRAHFPAPSSPFTISFLSLFILPFPHSCYKNWRRWPLVLAVEGLAHFLSSVNTGRSLPSQVQNSYYSLISHPADTCVDPGVTLRLLAVGIRTSMLISWSALMMGSSTSQQLWAYVVPD